MLIRPKLEVLMPDSQSAVPKGWLAFELNVLRRLKFGSAALPFTGDPALGTYLKRWDIRVLANDLAQSAWTKSIAAIQNNTERLTVEDLGVVLEDAYVPGYRLQNQALRNWFNETDSWWFDNVRENIDKLPSAFSRAIAQSIAMNVGDYVLSFSSETLSLRQPLSHVYRRLWTIGREPVNNGLNNTSQNKNAYEFIAEAFADLMFLRLPAPHGENQRKYMGWTAWREEWLRGGDDFWADMELAQAGRIGTRIETKSQYLRLLEEILRTASHIGSWAIAHIDDGHITTQDIVETIARIRRVDMIFTKDFSELTGSKAVIITA
jgi:hypothetical protein